MTEKHKLLILFYLILLSISGCSWFSDTPVPDLEQDASLDLPKIPYKTEWKGDIPADVEEHLKAVSLLIKLESRPPTSLNALHHRARSDKDRLKLAMADKGYFDGKISFTIVHDQEPAVVKMTFVLGDRYEISSLSVMSSEEDKMLLTVTPSKAAKAIQLLIGEQVDLSRIQEANERLAKFFHDHGYPWAEMMEPEGQIDRVHKRLHVIFRVKPGQALPFGKSTLLGLKNLSPTFVRNRLVWQEGAPFDERQVEKTRRKLMGTGLFSSLELIPDDETKGNTLSEEPVLMKISLLEGPPRTIGAGLRYATTEGIGGQLFWSHRNIFGGGESLGVSLKGSALLSRAKIDLDIPDVFAPEQHLRNEISVTRERNRAYTSRSLDAESILEHPFSDEIKGSIGLKGEAAHVKRADILYINRLIGVPLEVQIDASNDLLNPTKGGRLKAVVTPYTGRSGSGHHLTICSLRGSYYLPVLKGDVFILAGWAHGGVILAKTLEDVSPNKRFYSGGAGSVRAYAYKFLGPLDNNAIPLGGRTILEYGLEARFKFTQSIGFVAFVEAGRVSSESSPIRLWQGSSYRQLWGVGAGIRYHTAIGPVRLDVASPMRRRRDLSGRAIDSAYQFYLSVGQAF